MDSGRLIILLPFLALITWAAVEDIRSHRVRNWLTLTLMLTGLLHAALPHSRLSPAQSLAGLGIAFGITFIWFALGGFGAGDVKLLSGIGAWLGPWPTLTVLALTALVGGVLLMAQAIWQRRAMAVLRNTAILGVSLMHIGQTGVEQAKQDGRNFRALGRTVPYAVPIWVATLLTLFTPACVYLTGRPA